MNTIETRAFCLVVTFVGLTGCAKTTEKLERAGIVTAQNAPAVLLGGDIADGTVGDYYLMNDRIIAIVERPGRVFSVGPYGGNIIDLAPADNRYDVLNEALPFFQFGMTPNFTSVRVTNDGSDGEAAVIEATGEPEIWDFVNIESFMPTLFEYTTNDYGHPNGLLQFDPKAELPLEVRATYTLAPDADHVEVRYYLRNTSDEDLELRVGFGIDVRGEAEAFALGRGFTDPGVDLNDVEDLLLGKIDTPFIAYQTDYHAIGLRSRDFLTGEPVARMSLAVVGIALVMLGSANIIELVGEPSVPFVIEPGLARGYGFDLFLGHDVADVRAWAQEGEEDPSWGELGGVVRERGGDPIPGVRVAAIDPENGDVLVTFVTDDSGAFGNLLPAGNYHLAADDLARAEDPGRLVTVTAQGATAVDILLEASGEVNVDVALADDPFATDVQPGPCRIALIGEAPARRGGICGNVVACDTNEPFRHPKRWELGAPEPYVRHLIDCRTGTAFETPLTVVPGRYLAVVSRGPEYDFLTQLIDVTPGASVTVRGVIRRAVDSAGWAASEFHVHQVRSPDSLVPLYTRTRSLASAGLDFFATSDHDICTDLSDEVEELGLTPWITPVPGVEVSTIDIGHFNGFPIPPIAGLQGGSPPDWGGGMERPSPRQLFDNMRARGAQVVQVNHPRNRGSYFDRLNPVYDFDAGTIVAEPKDSLSQELMLMDPEEPLWATNFDTIEIYTSSRGHEAALRDWFNLLSMGIRPTGVGVSDSHDAYARAPGTPRTYVAVESKPPTPDDLITNLKAGHAFASSGPLLRVTARANDSEASFGETLSITGGDLEIAVVVETPAWYRVNTAELFFTRVYDDPAGDADEHGEPVGDRVESLVAVEVDRPNGSRALRYDLYLTYSPAELDALIGEGDGWLVVRVRGLGEGTYPVNLDGGVILNPEATSPGEFAQFVGGYQPFAVGNPIFFDRDGTGEYDPPYPYIEP